MERQQSRMSKNSSGVIRSAMRRTLPVCLAALLVIAPMTEAAAQTGKFLRAWGSTGQNLSVPSGIATDAAGNLYIADTFNNRIQKRNSAGGLLQSWGSTGNGDGQFNLAASGDIRFARLVEVVLAGVAVNQTSGNVYVADTSNHRVQRFSSAGVFLGKWGTKGNGNGQFDIPQGIAIDPVNGDVYVGDRGNNRVQKFSATGTFLATFGTPWGGGQAKGGEFFEAIGVAVDAARDVYVVDYHNHRIQKFDSNGNFLLTWGFGVLSSTPAFEICTVAANCQRGLQGNDDGRLQFPTDVTINSAGKVVVADWSNTRVQTFEPTGAWLAKSASFGFTAGPSGVAADGLGNLYVTDGSVRPYAGGDRAVKLNDTTLVETLSIDPVLGGDGEFRKPDGVAADTLGNVFVVDTQNSRVQKFNSSGDFLLKWGAAGSGDGLFTSPNAIATDPAGNVYVTDLWGVQKFDGGGAFQARWPNTATKNGIAADATHFYLSNWDTQQVEKRNNTTGVLDLQWGAPGADAGQLNAPWGLALDPATSDILVAERSNRRVSRFSNTGTFVRAFGWGVATGASQLEVCTATCQAGSSADGDGQFDQPKGIAVDTTGNIFVSEYRGSPTLQDNNRVQKFTGTGAFLGKWGGAFGTATGQFMGPAALSVDTAGDVYVVDRNDNRIQTFGSACPATLVIANQAFFGSQTRQAAASVTLGPALVISGSNVTLRAPTLSLENGAEIGGTFTAENTTSC